MDTLKIFRMAVKDYDRTIKSVIDRLGGKNSGGVKSTLGIISNVIFSISQLKEEERKKEDLDGFVKFVNSEASKANKDREPKKFQTMMGVKTLTLTSILNGIYNDNSKNLTFEELRYYVDYIVRLCKSEVNLSQDIIKEESIMKEISSEAERKLQEEIKIELEIQEKLEQEKKKLEEERLAAMSEGERLIEELINKKFDEGLITEVINKLDSQGIDDRKLVAEALKKNYEKIGLWNGKSSKKVKVKIEKIKKFL